MTVELLLCDHSCRSDKQKLRPDILVIDLSASSEVTGFPDFETLKLCSICQVRSIS